jgi:DNA polymerase-1
VPNKTLFLVDGTYTVFRSYFAIQRLNAPDGTPTNAVFGFINTLRKVIKDHAPSYFGVAFDMEGKTHRDVIFEQYKAHRPPAPGDLVSQFPLAVEVCEAMRWPVLRAEGYEADDVLATLAHAGRTAGLDVVLVTSDKDLYQLVGPGVQVLNPAKDDLMLDPAGVESLWGAPPERVRDVLALMGDATDNVPGVAGIGEKTAKSLIARYHSLDTVLQRAGWFAELWQARAAQDLERARQPARLLAQLEAQLGGEEGTVLAEKFAAVAALEHGDSKAIAKAFKALETRTSPKVWLSLNENEADARLSYELVTVRADAPVTLDLKALAVEPADAARATELFTRLGFRGLSQEFAASAQSIVTAADTLQIELLVEYEQLTHRIEAIRRAGALAIDTETNSLDARRAQLAGISLAHRAGSGSYIPVGHTTGEQQLPCESVLQALAPILEDPSFPKYGQNMKYDRAALRRAGVTMRGLAFDTMVAAQLADPGRTTSHKLDDLALRHLGQRMVPYSEVAGVGDQERTLDQVAVGKVARYAAEDAEVVWRLVEPLRELLKQNDLLELFETIEMPLVPILEEMEWHGIRLDVEQLSQMAITMERELKQLETEIYALAGRPFTINSPQQLRTVLFDELGLKPAGRRTQKTREHSTGQEALESLAAVHPLPGKVLEYREISKLKSTYVESLPKLVDPVDRRVHGSFHQLGAATGRLSSSDPNLQNIPVRTALGRSIRRCFIPEDGHVFVSADYSQMELRILAHLADDPALIAAFERGVDIHAYTASLVDGVPIELVTPEARARAKAVNFGIIYGMSEFRLAREQKMSREAAREFIDNYFKRYPKVREYLEDATRAVQASGETRTLYGRLRRFPELIGADSNADGPTRMERQALLRQAVNAAIQGTAADIAKKAMIALDRALERAGRPARLLLQVHDELLLECPEDQAQSVIPLVREAMEGAARLSVPLRVDVRSAATWADAH